MDLSEDRDWLDAYRRGAPDALERLFHAYLPYVLTILRRGARVGDDKAIGGVQEMEQQHEMVHEVFARVFSPQVRLSYDGLRPFAPYLAQLVRNAMVDRARSRGRRASRELLVESVADHDLERWTPGTPLPDEVLASEQQRELVQKFKHSLDSRDRELVQLRFEKGLGQEEVARQLRATRHWVRKKEEEIRERLRAILKK